ncbi:preprotein translocase subunit SecA [Mycoplasmopsis synoviae]|uniref:preprotein translocase subunit SecA n=1 Tax=Mycoplasmopsis synoviae TaxID=2109 RepID=UPI001CE0EF38|nr:preprotein translocase subunit SecA [Mycoplasmopsis synoviae]UBX97746.1 preprotein translocase subunit SecA [Mycoplasmopsis synoviae]UBX98781.1 preprotein translocase subunit SecA [Mycoplasmopsis synoviae]UBX99466.1 preprotein translocase subunit SecA [Mycoplasmopsis synoviae]UBX99808.1 preprotein translocase subunit SecA [Mycoplasmopsis synoviae]
MAFFSKFLNIKSTEMRIAEKSLKRINDLEKYVINNTDEELRSKTQFFKDLLKEGYKLEDIRDEVFAVAREATKRVLGKRPYDVQILGGILLDLGSVAEMKTGEGKTITSIAPVYLNALSGKGAIVSTVNEYLTERDAQEMGQVFNYLGLSVGINKAQMDPNLKRYAYSCDITYSVHSELGFDYLRDNMVSDMSEKVQRELNFCLIDEVDSILIDEAKTPLIISGGETNDSSSYYSADQFVRTLNNDDFLVDEESKAVTLTASGIEKANSFFRIDDLYNIEHSEKVHLIQNALRAHKVFKIDVEYIVKNNKIELVDAFTGRIMEGRSYSEGLQQAIQAKEMVEIEPETQTLATITYQNFFRMFNKLCGMTGTGKTEEQEFIDIYNMRVNVVPTNKPIAREDAPDLIFANAKDKWEAVGKEVERLYQKGQPVLVGTAQIEDSEIIHRILIEKNVPHTVLNAKQDKALEAEIIAQAGVKGAVTIATNMAGRGTDIKPSKEALELGGLYVLGTDKAESRRIDNQLRGRSGRQGDVGISRFYISLEDQLIMRFANFEAFQEAYAKDAGKEITNKQLRFAFNNAQKKIEGFNYDSRKSVLNYDDVIRQQRDLIYSQRDLLLISNEFEEIIRRMIKVFVKNLVAIEDHKLKSGAYDYQKLVDFLNKNIAVYIKHDFNVDEFKRIHDNELVDKVNQMVNDIYNQWLANAIEKTDQAYINNFKKQVLLKTLDDNWKKHINKMDKLRSNVNLVQYSQKNPYQIYTDEGTKMFEDLIQTIAFESVLKVFSSPLGEKSLITAEIKNDPLYQQVASTFEYNPYLSISEQEKQLLERYNNVKQRLNEVEQQNLQEQSYKDPASDNLENNPEPKTGSQSQSEHEMVLTPDTVIDPSIDTNQWFEEINIDDFINVTKKDSELESKEKEQEEVKNQETQPKENKPAETKVDATKNQENVFEELKAKEVAIVVEEKPKKVSKAKSEKLKVAKKVKPKDLESKEKPKSDKAKKSLAKKETQKPKKPKITSEVKIAKVEKTNKKAKAQDKPKAKVTKAKETKPKTEVKADKVKTKTAKTSKAKAQKVEAENFVNKIVFPKNKIDLKLEKIKLK